MSQHFKDKNFQPERANTCDLLIVLSSERISYAIIDRVQNQLQVLFDTSLLRRNGRIDMLGKLDELLDTRQELRYTFRKIKVSLQTSNYTFIPQALFDRSHVADYAKFITSDITARENAQVCELPTLGINNVIAFDNDFRNAIEQRFKGAHLFSQADPFISGISKSYTNPNTFIALNIQQETVEFAVFQANELVFYNLFDCLNADEFNYFLLHTIKELGLNKQTEVVTAGILEKNDEYYKRIQKYFDSINFCNTHQLLTPSTITDQLVAHHSFSLISLNLCE